MFRYLAVIYLAFAISISFAQEKGEFMPDEKMVYKQCGDDEISIHVFKPERHTSADNRPAIVFFFGGGWNGGSPEQFYPHCEYLASRGMVAISAEYRVNSRHKTTPRECVEDGKSCVRWIRQHAEELGIDPKRLAAGGGSAGAHVAAAVAVCKGFETEGDDLSVSCRPDALVLFNPVFDNGPQGYGYERVKEYWQEISPKHNISEINPPTLVMLGTKDRLIPVATAEEYKKLMTEKGVRCDLKLYEGQGHGFFNYSQRQNYYNTVNDMDIFLESLGYVQGKPTLKKPDVK